MNNFINSDAEFSDINKHIVSSGFNFLAPVNYDVLPSNEEEITSDKPVVNEIQSLIEDARSNKIRKLKARIEAILFLSEKPLLADHVAKQVGADLDLVRQCLSQLVQEYEDRQGGLVIDCNSGYCMQIRDEFEDLTEDILPIELRSAVLRTLSTIALKEPMAQKDLVQVRGAGIYEHVKELVEMGLVKRSKEGNTHILHTTKFFSENFKLSQNGIELQKLLKNAAPTDVSFVRNHHSEEDTESELLPSQEEINSLTAQAELN